MSSSGIPETGVTFFKFGGHSHDGVNSSEINTASYSIFDFGTGINTPNGDSAREASRNLNKIRFNGYIANLISSQILAPAGIVLAENTVTGRTIGAREITADKIVANTITANEVAANTLTADQIASNTITADELVTNLILVNNVIKSNNYVAGSAGWSISNTGAAEFSGATFRGTIAANAGNIGGWNITATSISSGNTTLWSNGDFRSSGTFSTVVSGITGIATLTNSSITGGNVNNARVASGTTFSANSTGYMTSLDGNISGITVGTTQFGTGTVAFTSTGFVSGSKSTEGVVMSNTGQLVFTSNSTNVTAMTPSNVASDRKLVFSIANSYVFDAVTNFTIGPSSGGTTAIKANLPISAGTGVVIDTNGIISRVSSRRHQKYNIESLTNSVNMIKQINPVTYKWRYNALEPDWVKFLKDSDPKFGFIVEELEEVHKGLVVYDYIGDSNDSPEQKFSDPINFTVSMFDPNAIISVTVGAVKELIENIESLEARIIALEGLVGG